MFSRQQALNLISEHIKNENLKKHLLAVEAVMRRFAPKFHGEAEQWALAGLLHDLDWEQTQAAPEQHTVISEKILTDAGLDPVIVKAISVHNYARGLKPETDLEKVLYYVEELTGLITACALVNPMQLGGVTVESVLKKLKEKSFARGVNRDIINEAPNQLGLPLEDIIQDVLSAMMEIREHLGL